MINNDKSVNLELLKLNATLCKAKFEELINGSA